MNFYAVVLGEALDIPGRARKGETLTMMDLAPLRAAVIADYIRRLAPTYTGQAILKLGVTVR